MGRAKGAKNKTINPPEIIGLEDADKLNILADILLQIIFEEGENAIASK